jgi:hypothetical protein
MKLSKNSCLLLLRLSHSLELVAMLSKICLDSRKHEFNWIEIWRIRWKKDIFHATIIWSVCKQENNQTTYQHSIISRIKLAWWI